MTVNDLRTFWMPYTWQRDFKSSPRMLGTAEGMFYSTPEGRSVLDATSGLWCVNAGHGVKKISEAIAAQLKTMDYAPSFQVSHPRAFEYAARLTGTTEVFGTAFLTNSGSEAMDSALKICLAYFEAKGEPRFRFIGRELGFHGSGFGGTSLGGIGRNRSAFGPLLPGSDHLGKPWPADRPRFIHGEPEHGGEALADQLEDLVALHGAHTIAGVVLEPVAGSAGVLIPPKSYLQRIRSICDKYGILLVFDEVITGFGRLGSAYGHEHFGVVPDLVVLAKGITNGVIPMGAVLSRGIIYETIVDGARVPGIELAHGYTYSGHPLACAAGLATLEFHQEEELASRARNIAPYFEQALHSLRDCRNVIDIRNLGLMGAIELAPRPQAAAARGYAAFTKAFENGLLVRVTGDTLAIAPSLIVERTHIDRIAEVMREVLQQVD